jgi:hypothetical protein
MIIWNTQQKIYKFKRAWKWRFFREKIKQLINSNLIKFSENSNYSSPLNFCEFFETSSPDVFRENGGLELEISHSKKPIQKNNENSNSILIKKENCLMR